MGGGGVSRIRRRRPSISKASRVGALAISIRYHVILIKLILLVSGLIHYLSVFSWFEIRLPLCVTWKFETMPFVAIVPVGLWDHVVVEWRLWRHFSSQKNGMMFLVPVPVRTSN